MKKQSKKAETTKRVFGVLLWLGIIVTAISLLIASVGIHPIVTHYIRPDISAARNALLKLHGNGFINSENPGFDLLVEYCICTMPRYEDLDASQIEMIGPDIWKMRKDHHTDPNEWPKTIWYKGKQSSVMTFSFRTINENFTDYVDRWKNIISINLGVVGLFFIVLSTLLQYFLMKNKN